MSTQHTPGPWAFRLEAVRTVIYHKAGIGEKAIAVGAGAYPDHIANARLIAAAPELLAAVEEAIASVEAGNLYEAMCCSGHDCGCRGSSNADLLVYDLRATIAKARGQ